MPEILRVYKYSPEICINTDIEIYVGDTCTWREKSTSADINLPMACDLGFLSGIS